MDASWLSGGAVLLSAGVGVAAYLSGRRQDRRSSSFEADRIRSEANDELIQNLRQDNTDLRGELAEVKGVLDATRVRLEQVSTECKTCQDQLDELSNETFGRRGMYRPKED